MEIFDLYDKDRNKLNQTMVRGDVQPEGTYRMAVSYTHLTLPTNMTV